MKCRGCGESFKKFGAGAKSLLNPQLCADCSLKEMAYHGFHAPGMRCDDEYLTFPRGGRSHTKLEEART